MLTVLTVFSALVLTLIILVPARPSRENVISMPSGRNVCAPLIGGRCTKRTPTRQRIRWGSPGTPSVPHRFFFINRTPMPPDWSSSVN
jgi:hypothetical protein